MKGLWAMVCGPSGAGKDSVIAWAQDALREHPRICFAQRLVTRAPQSAGHEAVSVAGIEALRRRGALAWHWQAHGLHYGVRAEYAQRVADGARDPGAARNGGFRAGPVGVDDTRNRMCDLGLHVCLLRFLIRIVPVRCAARHGRSARCARAARR